jgi:acetyl esterase/lipase
METVTSSELENFRKFYNNLGGIHPPATNVAVEHTFIDNISCYWFSPQKTREDRIIIYLHGGSFVAGSIQSHKAMVSHLAQSLNNRILFIEYALAPEKPYPSGINDAVKVYSNIIGQNSSSNIILMGDSAGGGILLSSVGMMQEMGLKQPIGVIMISPHLNLECDNESYETHKNLDPILTKEIVKKYDSLYIGDVDIAVVNPINTALKSFPPVLVLVGSNEILIDESKHMLNQVKGIQKLSNLSIFEHQTHVWLMSDIYTEASQLAIGEMKDFIDGL